MRYALIASLLVATACSHGSRVEPSGTPSRDVGRTDGGMAAPPVVAAPPDATTVVPPMLPAKIKITIRTTPSKGVRVSWGKKKLGVTPLTIERPRDSGPVDLVLRLGGYFPVHTRAYTVKNDTIGVKLVKLQDRMTVFGAKQEVPPENAPLSDPSLDPANALKPAPSPAPPTVPPPLPATL